MRLWAEAKFHELLAGSLGRLETTWDVFRHPGDIPRRPRVSEGHPRHMSQGLSKSSRCVSASCQGLRKSSGEKGLLLHGLLLLRLLLLLLLLLTAKASMSLLARRSFGIWYRFGRKIPGQPVHVPSPSRFHRFPSQSYSFPGLAGKSCNSPSPKCPSLFPSHCGSCTNM